MAKKSVAIIIVNWNGLEHLKLCLPSLAKQSYPTTKIYIVDNNSSDDSMAYVKQEFPEVECIQTGKNLGFAGGNNVGMEAALKAGHDYLFLLNNDTTVKSNIIRALVDYMETHPRVGIAQPKLLLMDHPDRLDSCGSWLTWTGFPKHFGVEEEDGPMYDKIQPMFTIKGAAMIIRRQTLESIGLFDDNFFAYFEETDLCWRAWLRGWRVMYAPVSTVYHKMGGSTAKIGSPTINFHSFKNRIMSMLKNLEWQNAAWMIPVHILFMVPFSLIYFVFFRFRSGLSVYRAIGWNITHWSVIMKERREIQQHRVVRDKELFKTILKPVDWSESFSFAGRFARGKRKTDLIKAKK